MLALALLSCGGGRGLAGDLAAMEGLAAKKDCAALWGMVSAKSRAGTTKEQFVASCAANAKELQASLAAVREAGGKKGGLSAHYTATVLLKDGTTVALVREDGAWKLDSDLVDFYPSGTPREALASFVKAFAAKRWDVLAALMPSQYAAGDDAKALEAQWGQGEGLASMTALVTVLGDHLDDKVTVNGESAFVEFAPQHRAELLRENGAWRIVRIY